MRKPDFFILGAPKCGTTSIAAWLSRHPDVFVTPVKEPHHFNTDMAHRLFPDRAKYEALYDGVTTEKATGEASVWYLFSQDAVPNIEKFCDTPPRYVVCLRNPVDMAYSLHEQQVFSGNEDQKDFAVAWGLADKRRQGQNIPRRASDPTTVVYADACALGTQLERLFARVDRNRVHVILMSDLRDRPRAVFDNLQKFLGVEADPSIELTVENMAKQRLSLTALWAMQVLGRIKVATGSKVNLGLLGRLDAWNRKTHARAELDPALRSELLAHFEAETTLVERLLNRQLPDWRK